MDPLVSGMPPHSMCAQPREQEDAASAMSTRRFGLDVRTTSLRLTCVLIGIPVDGPGIEDTGMSSGGRVGDRRTWDTVRNRYHLHVLALMTV